MTESTNPLLSPWTTPFGVPPFAGITPDHFPVAFDKALAEHRGEIDAIAADPNPPTVANTLDTLERSGSALERVSSVFWHLAGAHTNDDLQALERALAPQMADHFSAITANSALFQRLDDLWRRREELPLTDEQYRALERSHKRFVRAGAALDEPQKQRLAAIKSRLATLGTQFGQNVLADERDFQLPLFDEADLAGLPEFVVTAAAAAARERGATANYIITLSRSLIEPFLAFSTRRDLREQAFRAWSSRGESGGASDNRAIVAEMLALRQERAALLGFATFADYQTDDRMAKTPKAVRELLETVWAAASRRVDEERAALQALAADEGLNDTLAPWDWRFYAERRRHREFALDETELKPYFPLEQMIQAAFYTAQRLFGLAFTERTDLAFYHPSVRAFEVKDRRGQPVGLFVGDYFNRASKRSGAWMSALRRQQRLAGDIRPIVVNVANFAPGGEGQPALLSFDDARTLFHEFGHALHGLLSDVTYPSLSGTSVAQDFVELPSQLFEHWLLCDEVLERFARRASDGAPLPAELREKLRAARTYNQGFATTEYLASAMVDLDLHAAPRGGDVDPLALEADTLARMAMPEAVAMRHRTPHFLHLFTGDGYAAGYYSYLWSEVLDADAFAAFEETGDVFHPDIAQRLKAYIYAAGGTRDEAEAYKAFRGALPKVEGLLKKRGLVAA
ncbi:MAG: M3 family metallopeptidase [Candidatus Competibacterales bacterium]